MKKAKRILLIVAALVAAAVILVAAYVFTGLNWHYLFDLRAFAQPPKETWSVTPTEAGVRVAIPSMGSAVYAQYGTGRECLPSDGISPISLDRGSLWGCWSYEAFVAKYSEHHVDLGHNAYIPAWFTSDGYLISLWFGGGKKPSPLCISNIGEVEVFDLLAAVEQ